MVRLVHNMRVLIRDKSRKLYLAERGRWVEDAASGHDFHSCDTAIAHLRSQRLTGVDLWCAFPNSKYDFSLPTAAYSSPASPQSECLQEQADDYLARCIPKSKYLEEHSKPILNPVARSNGTLAGQAIGAK
jgi:hypothetical protein